MFFHIDKGEPVIDPDYLVIPSIRAYANRVEYDPETGKGNDKERMYTKYIYFAYHKRSPFYHMEITHRKESCSLDFLGDKNLYKELEKNPIIAKIIRDLKNYQFTDNEALVEGVKNKVSEYIDWWNKTEVSMNTSSGMKSKLRDAKELISIRKELEAEVKREQALGVDVDTDKASFIERITLGYQRRYKEAVETPKTPPAEKKY